MIKLMPIIAIFGFLLRHDVNAATSVTREQKWLSRCKGDTASISCDSGKVIVMTSARYGGFPDNNNPCSQPISQDCQEEHNVIESVQKLCYKKTSCTFSVDDKSLSGRCSSSQYLHLKISYVCVAESSLHDLCTKLDPTIRSGFLVSPGYPENAQTSNSSERCNVTMTMQSRHHVITFTPIDLRVPPSYLVRKCGMVFYINLKQDKNLKKICTEISGAVSLHGGEAAHVFTNINSRDRGRLFALVHFQNNAMMAYEICRRRNVISDSGIIVSPTVADIDQGCTMEIKRSPEEEIVLKFVRKEISENVGITKCDHGLIIANRYQYAAKLTADCRPNQMSTVFRFHEHTTITFVASSTDKVEIEYSVVAYSSEGSVDFKPVGTADKPTKDWMIILIVCCVVFVAVVAVLVAVYWRKRSQAGKKTRQPKYVKKANETTKIHTVSKTYSPPEWADTKSSKGSQSSKSNNGHSTTRSRDSSMMLPESKERVWRENPTLSTSDITEIRV